MHKPPKHHNADILAGYDNYEAQQTKVIDNLAAFQLDFSEIGGRVVFNPKLGRDVLELHSAPLNIPFNEISTMLAKAGVENAEIYVDDMIDKINIDNISKALAKTMVR